MTRRVRSPLWTAALLAAAMSASAAAHHSFAMFDQNKQVELRGVTVTRFAWTNPHAFVVAEASSAVYTLECSSPNLMTHAGWTHGTLKPGDKVDIAFYPLRNGNAGGMLKTVKLPDGRTLNAW